MADILIGDPSLSGVVTFLDVLGWKGVYDRKSDAIESLARLVKGLNERAVEKRGRIFGDLVIKSISDTIAIFSVCSDAESSMAIEIHGELCQWIIPKSIEHELPVRGATSFGKFSMRDNIFVGKAIDEAASWHEQTDWIGVHLTPSADFTYQEKSISGSWKRYCPPHKNRLTWEPYCVDWTTKWIDRQKNYQEVKEMFKRLGPLVPEIAGKYVNTLQFIDHMTMKTGRSMNPKMQADS